MRESGFILVNFKTSKSFAFFQNPIRILKQNLLILADKMTKEKLLHCGKLTLT